ncbi:SDR family oxidoreductase [Pseudomonas alloputida]|jgi:short-subunit dehydrogenase|uniref:Short-chain dehydrogenase n=3 Tax=Pseudomonas TaxID=286 RepID=A0A1Y3LED8_PSEPU|nr:MULTISPECIES: SDR family oxidoreductase [Pseudomonas]PNB62160.1 KR domain-containing protein [Pseudomonas sp. FW305-130]AGN81838.1 short-chain dehydrogenase [Pseudomonas putida H8234]EKT4459832.1 SDR family oxidoreductase [Pseudomonas putida]EKT4502508.1 SDR family oxidoreductase [Pseudomonas putida]EKT4538871.1 SDR family oxidoreductase [Pseudomonas putida]
MIDQATGMKSGERYRVENVERAHQFPGFFQDGKYYLGPELLTAVGWLEGTRFIYDSLDAAGEPVFPNREAGTIEGLTLTLVDGTSLELSQIEASDTIAHLDPAASGAEREAPDRGATLKGPLGGKVVVITGASSGIGRAAAHAFACKGARLVLAARDEEALFDVLDECTDCGTDAIAIMTDVTHSDQVQALAAQAADFGHGRIDIWVNNAGVGAVGKFEETPLEAHEQVIQTDLIGYLRGAYVALPFFKAQGSGILINTLSLGSWMAQPYAAAYSASKFGLRGLTEALRGELTEYPDIHVCDIYPAVMDTPGFRDGGNYTGHTLRPPGPVYDPERVAKAMVACAISPRAHTTVGAAARIAHLASYLIPGLPLLSGKLTRWGINRSPTAEASSGNLFEPPSGRRGIVGGWREANDKTPLLIGAAALGILVGYTLTHSRRRDS